VRKRDGRVVPFERGRIVAAVRRAQDAVGDHDPLFSEEVADVVALALGDRQAHLEPGSPAAIPEIEQIQDLVEQALIEMGRAALAKAYILYRDRRARAREALTITERPERGRQMPLVRAGGGTSPWDQGRIVAALMEEAALPREIAEEVAERVEERVHDARLRRVSTTLVRELVDNELMAMGLETALHRQESVGIPRHDLRQLLSRPRLQGAGPEEGWWNDDCDLGETVGGEILARYALTDVVDERTADLHRAGALDIEGVSGPHQVLSRAVPAELCIRGEPGPRSGYELLAELAPLVAGSGRCLVLEGLAVATAPMLRGARSNAGLRDLLVALGAVARAAGRRLDLGSPGGRGGRFTARLLGELASLATQGNAAPRLYLTLEELQAALDLERDLEEAAEALLVRGALVPVWHGKDERWAAPGCRRRPRERGAIACAGAVAINLPRLARQAGPWREDLFLEALVARVRSALDSLEALDAFQRRHPAARPDDLRERIGWALSPVGLVEALRILADGEVRPGQGARILGVLSDASRRFGEERGLALALSPFFGERAGARMARIDAGAPRATQRRLFSDLPAPEATASVSYTTGYALPASLLQGGAGHAALLATVRAGALHPSVNPESSADDPRPMLAAWRRFVAQRLAGRSIPSRSPRPSPAETEPLFGA